MLVKHNDIEFEIMPTRVIVKAKAQLTLPELWAEVATAGAAVNGAGALSVLFRDRHAEQFPGERRHRISLTVIRPEVRVPDEVEVTLFGVNHSLEVTQGYWIYSIER